MPMSIQSRMRSPTEMVFPDVALEQPARFEPADGAVLVMDPLQNPAAWDALVAADANASFFHTSAWARVLHETYGHAPVYFFRRNAGQASQVLPVMEVNSPWTGRRGVSLPFTDECPLLGVSAREDSGELYEKVAEYGRARGWKYLETRGGRAASRVATPSVAYFGHQLDLVRSESDLFAALDGSVRRGIRKAEGAGLKVELGNGLGAMRAFYRLHCRTRRRHGVPPQPFRFFENIARDVLAERHGCVFTVSCQNRVVAAAVFFRYGRRAIYKFGASDPAFQALRPNNLLMWEAIKWHARLGLASLHLGRTSLFADGLRRFKLGFGAREERIEYCRYDFASASFVTGRDRSESWLNSVFRCLPLPVLRLAGHMLYPHLS